MPGPLVGSPYTPTHLPTSSGLGGDSNYYSLSNPDMNPQLQMGMNDSGYLTKSSYIGGGKRRKGGSNDVVNLGREAVYNGTSAWNAWNGVKAPPSPSPTEGQLMPRN